MVRLWLPRGPWVAAVILTLMVLSPPVASVRDPQRMEAISPEFLHLSLFTPLSAVLPGQGCVSFCPVECDDFRARFLEQRKSECHFYNGTQHVRLLDRFFYNREEYVRFDSDLGEFRAVTELGRPSAKYWNSQKEILDYRRAALDTFCRHNYGVGESFTVQRRVEPQVTVYPAKTEPQEHHNLLVCSVSSFYPGQIEVRWFRNDQEEKAGVVSTGLIRNGDWTFQTLVMLEMVPQSGDVYTCQVEHPSLTSPVTVEWRAQSSSAQNKMLSGVGGFVLGLLFLGLGLFVYFRNQKGQSGLQPTGLLS